MTASLAIFDQLSALSDPIRCRLLLVLERHEVTVSELCTVVQLPQSTVSRHLKVLSDEGWVVSYPEGTTRRYRMVPGAGDPAAKRLWTLVREQVGESAAAAQDARRLDGVLARRRTTSQVFFSSTAGQWDRLRAELFGQRTDLLALAGLVDSGWTVGDLGCGTGEVARSLAPFVRRVIAVDESSAMLGTAKRRLARTKNVEIRRGALESIPIENAELDAAIVFLVLHYVLDPAAVLREVARVLRPGGRLALTDMMPHDREEYRHSMGHLWQGFSAEQITGWLGEAGLVEARYIALATDAEAKGPSLFVATATKH